MAEDLFDSNAQTRIAQAVAEAEAKTVGEIVPVIVGRCDAYPEARYRGGLIAAILASTIAPLLPLDSFTWLVAIQFVAFLIGFAISAWDPLERLLIGRKTMDEAARAYAARAFFEHGVHRTAEGTGVLVFIAMFEHEVVVLGDRAIHAKMGDEGWKRVVDGLVSAVKAGKPVDGLTATIRGIGETLAQHFPSKAGAANPNELPDSLRFGSRPVEGS